ncbi:MAG: c-type cytochrome [Chloroflexota bacterium]
MKFHTIIILLGALVLSACNFSLAEDITPPPNYVSPTPLPDIGTFYPEEAPSPGRGEEFFSGSCAPCHGENGLGNGPMAGNMPVAVPAIGLRDISSQAAPADWYRTITLGNLERGMPPFSAHPSQERWDVLAHTYMLSTTPEELQRGADLYAANCTECHGPDGSANPEVDFTNQEYMSQMTGISLYRGIAEGRGEMKPFADQLSEDDIWAIVAHLRSLTFDLAPLEPAPTITPEPSLTPEAAASATPEGTLPAETGTPEGTLPAETATPGPIKVAVTGSVTNASGTGLGNGLTATLFLYNTTDGQMFDSLSEEVSPDGTYLFNDVYADTQMGYWVSVDYQDVTYYSALDSYDGTSEVLELPVTVYDSTTDWLALRFDLVHIALEFSTGVMQVSELYVISNPATQTVILETDGTSLPFIVLPEGVIELTSLSPDSRGASFLPATNGIALPPLSDGQYGVVASFSMPYDQRLEFSQDFPMPVSSLTLFTLEGMRIKSDQLTDAGTQDFSGTLYHLYEASNLPAGPLAFTVSGTPGGSGTAGLDQRTWLVIGVGALGVVFVGLGIFLFLRDRALAKKEELADELEEETEEDALGSDPEAITDAIIALDEQLKNGEISKEAHQKRRSELKARLMELLAGK